MPKECAEIPSLYKELLVRKCNENLLRTHTLTQARIKHCTILWQALLVQHQVYERELPPEVYMNNSIVISWFKSSLLDVCLLTAASTFYFSYLAPSCHHYQKPSWKFRPIFNSPGFYSRLFFYVSHLLLHGTSVLRSHLNKSPHTTAGFEPTTSASIDPSTADLTTDLDVLLYITMYYMIMIFFYWHTSHINRYRRLCYLLHLI
jgi:hypothetical protein